MTGASAHERRPAQAESGTREFLRDAFEGLSRDRKSLPGKYLWDERGSSIFDAICKSEGYYVAALETALLHDCAGEVAEMVGRDACIVEFGSGVSRKVRVLLDAMDRPASYIAIDISRAFMEAAAERLRNDFPALDVSSVCADYTRPLPALPVGRAGAVLGFFPGSALGNMAPGPAVRLLRQIGEALAPGWLLVGQDHTGEAQRLKAAYGGPLMAAFHRNVLARMTRELNARIELDAFGHEARILPDPVRVEAHLAAGRATVIEIGSRRFRFGRGDSICTDVSWKYSPSEFRELAAAAGLSPMESWTCSTCALHLLR